MITKLRFIDPKKFGKEEGLGGYTWISWEGENRTGFLGRPYGGGMGVGESVEGVVGWRARVQRQGKTAGIIEASGGSVEIQCSGNFLKSMKVIPMRTCSNYF